MEFKIGSLVVLIIAAILLSSMLPMALGMFYKQPAQYRHAYGYDENAKAIASDINITGDATVSTIWNLFPLFGVLGGLVVLAGIVLKKADII